MRKKYIAIIFLILSILSFGKFQRVSKYQIKDIGDMTISLIGNEPLTGMVIDGKDREYYEKGKPDGKWVTFYDNGKMKSIENWKDGMLHGKYVLYNENGKKVLETYYKEGIDNGKYAIYYPNGKPRILGKIKNGVPVGKWEKYNENGKLLGVSKY
ncbi:toxin-antitoxin system YwqK family antitoxin [Fusobacterium sp.]|uniref:toxin-antitoxin system YwqK family antitoxin n=1 Tax=Fusobacterium sp. TaxID=68766 RepID=UPI00260BD05E|nr:toxin-antitoxin system YwqK family antitoxin [Fusobacterium sp.]